MNADEWDLCPRSDWMMRPLHEWLRSHPDAARAFERKLRLYAVACCRQRWELFETDLFRRAVDAAERLAEGRADREELSAIYQAILEIPTPNEQSHCIENMTLKLIGENGMTCASSAAMDLGIATGWDDFEAVVRAQAPLLRCVAGNPFRPVAFDPAWRTPAIAGLAEQVDADQDFEILPILGDALEEAGCDHIGMLSHCRDGGSHARGCWVIDRLLGRG